jgi:hypothetical protein
MRKLIMAALVLFALGSFVAAGTAYAGDCGKCKDSCVKCKQDTCTTCEKPCKSKCEPCKPDCNKECCKPKCKPDCQKDCCARDKCVKCKQDTCTTCKPKCEKGCKQDCCKPKCDPCQCGKGHGHPYECCFTGTGMMCDTGCCNAPLICKRSCVDCETICKKVETKDPCTGCVTVDYVYETVCHEVTRPRVIPWWFNEAGTGNIYPDEDEG